MEADAVSVDTRAARPVGQPAGISPIERLERSLVRRFADDTRKSPACIRPKPVMALSS